MDDTIGSIAVPERLAVLRTEAPTNPSVLRELADNLLQFSRSLDQHGDMNGAFEAARDGIMALARTCYAEDEELTALMDALARRQGPGAGDGARLMMLVLHDDAEREYAYGPANGLPDTKVGTFSQSLMDEAKQHGWTVISMKNDWNRIFSSEAKQE
jgi:hypothetical protein